MKRYRMDTTIVHHEMTGSGGEPAVVPVEDPAGEWVRSGDADVLLVAAKAVLAQFQGITRRQDELLVQGQTLERAAANWDEATLGQSIDFQALMDAMAVTP